MTETINWSGKEWYTREQWGSIHPEKPWNWYDPSCLEVIDGRLDLHIKKNPKVFTLPDKNGGTYQVESPYGTGLISSVDYYEYGEFTIEAALPRGIGLWPAFWIYDHNDWPPEVDIMEGYSGKKGDYKNNCIKRLFYPYNVESCFHSRKSLLLPNVSPKAYSRDQVKKVNYNPFVYNKYALLWHRNYLVFRLNNRIVRVIYDPNIMDYLAGRKMRVLINNHIQKGFQDTVTSETPFRVLYFKYEKH